MSDPACRLYLITPPAIDDFAALGRALGEALEAGDVGALQLRLKGAPESVIEAAAHVLRPMARSRGIPLDQARRRASPAWTGHISLWSAAFLILRMSFVGKPAFHFSGTCAPERTRAASTTSYEACLPHPPLLPSLEHDLMDKRRRLSGKTGTHFSGTCAVNSSP